MIEPQLTEVEARVLGALVEKSVTTPEYYPLSLVALVNACNQKSNRDPVVDYDTRIVGEALNTLREKGLARTMMGGDSRVPKYRHYFDEAYELTAPETAVLCELMLRGPQTVGELRGRIERFNVTLTLPDAEGVVNVLETRGFVKQLPRLPGRREVRYAHLLAGEPAVDVVAPAAPGAPPARDERLAALEEEVLRLRGELDDLRAQFAAFKQQFE